MEIKAVQPFAIDHMRYFSCPKGKETKLKEAMTNGDYFAQRKIDGASYLYSKSLDGQSALYSRSISTKTNYFSEKSANVPHIIQTLDEMCEPGTMLIGEIAFGLGHTSKDTTSVMGCLPAKAVSRNKIKPISYFIFDILAWDGEDLTSLPAEDRIKKLIQTELGRTNNPCIQVIEPVYDNIPEMLSNYLINGGEGIVLKLKSAPYDTNGKRPAWHTIKVKTIDTVDVAISDIIQATKEYTGTHGDTYEYRDADGNPVNRLWAKGWPAALEIMAYSREKEKYIVLGTVASGLTDALRAEIASAPNSFIGKVIEVECMSIDKENWSLRHPRLIRIHNDKQKHECILEEIFR